MTETSPQRLFFALWPDPAVRRALAGLGREAAAGRGRPVHPEDLHLTLVFLGSVAPERLEQVTAAAGRVRFQPFELRLDHYGWWPRPRVLWCAPAEVPPPLPALFGELQRELAACGFAPEKRAYRPHITLARKVSRGRSGTLEEPIRWPVREFVLVSSRTHGDPPRYRVLKKWPADS